MKFKLRTWCVWWNIDGTLGIIECHEGNKFLIDQLAFLDAFLWFTCVHKEDAIKLGREMICSRLESGEWEV